MRTPKIPDSLKVFVRALAARLAPRASRSGKTSATAEKTLVGVGLGTDERAQVLLDESKRARFNQRAEDFFRETREGDWR